MPVHVDELHTEVETRAPEARPEAPEGDDRWPRAERVRKDRRDDSFKKLRTRAEGFDD
jgi:hypothetical protein